MLDDWLGSDAALAPLRARIEARARGNPLFVEEIVRSLVERGVLRGERGAYAPAAPIEEIALPETVQAVLASRIDRLAHARQGRAPGRGRGRARRADGAAARRGRSARDPSSPRRSSGSRRPSFSVPPSLRVSAPSGIPSRRRSPTAPSFWIAGAGRTPRVARALLAIHGSAAPTHAALLAHHFEEAGEHLEAARWHEQAGRRVARSDPADGVRHCRRVTALLAAVPESRETLMLELTSRIALLEIGRIAGIEEREAQDLFDEARAVAERLRRQGGPRVPAHVLRTPVRARGRRGAVPRVRGARGGARRGIRRRGARVRDARGAGPRAARGRPPRSRPCDRRASPGRARAGRRTAGGARALHRTRPCAASGGRWRAPTSGSAAEARGRPGSAPRRGERARAPGPLRNARHSCARCCACGAICPARSPTAAVPSSSRKSAEARSPGWRPRRFSAPRSSRPATSPRPRACSSARSRSRAARRTALWYEPRILATLADAKLAAGDRSGARALLAEARELVDRGRGWRLGAFDVALAWVRLLAGDAVPTAPRSRARSSPWTPSRPSWAPILIGGWRRSSARASLERSLVARAGMDPSRMRGTR